MRLILHSRSLCVCIPFSVDNSDDATLETYTLLSKVPVFRVPTTRAGSNNYQIQEKMRCPLVDIMIV